MKKIKFIVFYNYGLLLSQFKKLGDFDTIDKARECIKTDLHYDKLLFDDMGNATSYNKNRHESYIIFDNKDCERFCIRN